MLKTADNLKVGDKLKCIKTFKSTPVNDLTFYIENNLYPIKNILCNTVEIETNYGLTLIFNFKEQSNYKFNEYFITLKQDRKQKLDKLNATR